MNGSLFHRIVAGLLAILTSAQSVVAFADPPRASAPTYTFSSDLPDSGKIDMYHDAMRLSNPAANALYLLRNVAVEDLLNNRKALKILLGGTERARRVSGDAQLTFDVPSGVIDLYVLGELGRSYDNLPGSGSSSSSDGSHGITTASLTDFARSIHWFSDNEFEYNANLRARQMMDWIHFSARITRYDQLIKFLKEDYWQDRSVRRQLYNQYVLPLERMQQMRVHETIPNTAQNYVIARDMCMTDHETNDQLAVLEGHRQMQLDRYNLLGITVGEGDDAKPLYQHIYKAMESAGFPSARMAQRPVTPGIPRGNAPIELPTQFDDAANAALDRMISTDAEIARVVSTVSNEVNAKIDKALVESLRVNTQRLAYLTSQIHHSSQYGSPLIDLIPEEQYWEAAMQKYGYLDGLIDLVVQKERLQTIYASNQRVTRNTAMALTFVGVGVGVALGVHALLAAGTVGAIGSVGAAGTAEAVTTTAASSAIRSALLHGSALLTATGTTMSYVQARDTAKISRGIYLGTMSSGSHAQYRQDELMEESAFRDMLLSMIFLGHTPAALATVGRGVELVTSGGRTLVRLTAAQRAALLRGFQDVARRAEVLTPVGRMLVAGLRGFAGAAGDLPAVMTMEEALNAFSIGMRMTRAEIARRLETNALIGPLLRNLGEGVRARFVANPDLWQKIIREEIASVGLQLVVEGTTRDDFAADIGDISIHTAANFFQTGAMVILTAPLGAAGTTAQAGGFFRFLSRVDEHIPTPGNYRLLTNAAQLGLVGFMGNFAASAIGEMVRFADPDDTESAWDHASRSIRGSVYSGVFAALSSNTRRMVVMSIENNLARVASNQATGKILLSELSVANNAFGTWHYVELAQLLGVEKENGEFVSEDRIDPNGDPSTIRRLVLQHGDAHYFRVDGEANESRLFDFTQGTHAP